MVVLVLLVCRVLVLVVVVLEQDLLDLVMVGLELLSFVIK